MNDFKTITRWKGCQVCLFPMPFCVSTIFCVTSSQVITTASLWAFWCGVHVIPWRLVCWQNTRHAMVAQSAHSRHDNDITTMNQHRCRLLVYPKSTKQKHGTLTETKNIKSQSFILHIQHATFSCCCILTLWYSMMLYMLKITWQCLSSPYLYSSLLQITPGILLSPQSVKSPSFLQCDDLHSVISHKTTSFKRVPELFSVHTLSDIFISIFTTSWNSILIPYTYSSLRVLIRFRLSHRLDTDWKHCQVLTGNRETLHIQLHVCQYFCVRQPETPTESLLFDTPFLTFLFNSLRFLNCVLPNKRIITNNNL